MCIYLDGRPQDMFMYVEGTKGSFYLYRQLMHVIGS